MESVVDMKRVQRIQKILLSAALVLFGVELGIAITRGNGGATSAWLVTILMTICWLSEISIVENLIEDCQFWKGRFLDAQERYARTVPVIDEPEPPKKGGCF